MYLSAGLPRAGGGEIMNRRSIPFRREWMVPACGLILAVLVLSPGCTKDVATPEQDNTYPSAVTDLAADNPTSNTIDLNWTASGDDWMAGRASQYDVRYSISPIDYSNWESATQCAGEPAPGDPGSPETYVVPDLTSNTVFYFAVKTADDVPNWSDLSNVASARTAPGPGDGFFVAWGDSTTGQCDVPTPNEGFSVISTGGFHNLGLKRDGSIVAWGAGDFGQCDVPEPNAGFVAVAAGRYHSLGLESGGSIVVWGSSWYDLSDVPEPNADFVAIAAAYEHCMGLKNEASSAWPPCWSASTPT